MENMNSIVEIIFSEIIIVNTWGQLSFLALSHAVYVLSILFFLIW